MNKLDLVGHENPSKMEVIAITDNLAKPATSGKTSRVKVAPSENQKTIYPKDRADLHFNLKSSDIERAIYAKVVQKCGRRLYWEEWASDIAEISPRRTYHTHQNNCQQRSQCQGSRCIQGVCRMNCVMT